MGKTFTKSNLPKVHRPRRNAYEHIARMRRSEKFHDRRDPRGGSRNDQADLLDDWDLDDVG